MTTIHQHLSMMNSSAYCPACGASKLVDEDYCLDCYLQSEDITLCSPPEVIYLDVDGWPEPMYPYEVLPIYTVGYVSDVTTFTP